MKKEPMKQIFCLLTIIWLSTGACWSQTTGTNNANVAINQIKKSKAFLYGEATMPTKEGAYELASEILQQEIETWAKEHSKKKADKIVATDVRQLVDSIIQPRANMIRVFLYVRKSNLIPVYREAGLVIVDADAKSDAVVAKDSVSHDSIVTPIPVTPTIPNADSIATEKVSNDSISSLTIPTDSIHTEQVFLPTTSDSLTRNERVVIDKVKPLQSFFKIRDVLVPLKEQGLVESYGKYATLSEPDSAYLIIYDINGRIRAVLGKGKEKRTNLNTGEQEGIEDYKECGAIWFKVKQ